MAQQFDVEIHGQRFVVEADDFDAAVAAVQQYSQYPPGNDAAEQPAPAGPPAPIKGTTQPIDPTTARWQQVAPSMEVQPQDALDMAFQTAGTMGGMALGTLGGPASPVTVPAGAAAGNVAGKQLARRIGQWFELQGSQPPDLASLETAIDAALGASGPLGGTALRSAGRALTGLKQAPFNQAVAEETTARTAARVAEIGDEGRQMLALLRAGATPEEAAMRAAGRTPPRERDLIQFAGGLRASASESLSRESIDAATSRAVRTAIDEAGSTSSTVRRGIGGATIGGLAALEPVTGALIGAGISEAVLSRAVPRLLESRYAEPFARWALNVTNQRPAERAASLAAIFAGQQLSAEERQAFTSIQSRFTSSPIPRDADTGRFIPRVRARSPHDGHPAVEAERERDAEDEQ